MSKIILTNKRIIEIIRYQNKLFTTKQKHILIIPYVPTQYIHIFMRHMHCQNATDLPL